MKYAMSSKFLCYDKLNRNLIAKYYSILDIVHYVYHCIPMQPTYGDYIIIIITIMRKMVRNGIANS